jgi:hypothetical protein
MSSNSFQPRISSSRYRFFLREPVLQGRDLLERHRVLDGDRHLAGCPRGEIDAVGRECVIGTAGEDDGAERPARGAEGRTQIWLIERNISLPRMTPGR